MAYKTTLTKVVSFITLLTFLSTNSIYAAPDFKSNFKLRVPVSINKDRIDDGLTANGVRKRETFPVKMVDEKGRPKRGDEAKVVASGRYKFQRSLKAAQIEVGQAATRDVKKTAAIHTYALQKILARYEDLPLLKEVLDAVKKGRNAGQVEFIRDNDTFMDIAPVSDELGVTAGACSTRFDLDIASKDVADIDFNAKKGEISSKDSATLLGVAVLSALGQYHEWCHAVGMDENKALIKTLELYLVFSKEEQGALLATLRTGRIDHSNVFSLFLEDATNSRIAGFDLMKPENKVRRYKWWLQKIAGLKSSMKFSLPYDLQKVHDVIYDPALSKDEQAERLMAEVYARGRFDSKAERENAYRMAKDLLDESRDLVVAHHGRASYFVTLLAAAARYITDLNQIKASVAEMEVVLKGASRTLNSGKRKNPEMEGLFEKLSQLHMQLESRVEEILVLLNEKDVSKAQLQGATSRLSEYIDKFEGQYNELITSFSTQRKRDEQLLSIAVGADFTKLNSLRDTIHKTSQKMRRNVEGLNTAISISPSRHANFIVLLQAPLQQYIRLLALVNLGVDPFEMNESHIQRALIEGGENAWGSPDNAWLEVCSHWISALPLFIHEERLTLKNGKIVTQLIIEQEILEGLTRGAAVPSFKNNIQLTMDTEHISLARQILVTNNAGYLEEAKKYLREHPNADFEEASLAVITRHLSDKDGSQLAQDIAGLSVIIDRTEQNLRPQIDVAQEKYKLLRYDALRGLLQLSGIVIGESEPAVFEDEELKVFLEQSESNKANLVKQISELVAQGGNISQVIDTIIKEQDEFLDKNTSLTFRLAKKRESILSKKQELGMKNGLLDWKRREMPTWIILTTQAAGMSDFFTRAWLEDEIALHNLTTNFYSGELRPDGSRKTLEDEAQELLADYESKIARIAERLIKEFRLEHRIDEYMATTGQKDRKRVILNFVRGYADLATEVAKAFMLTEAVPEADRKYDNELKIVNDYVNEHRAEVEEEAVKRLISDDANLKRSVRKGAALRAETLINDPVYGSELQKYIMSVAREKVIESHPFSNMLKWYVERQSETSLPRILRLRLNSPSPQDKGITTAREEVINKYFIQDDGKLVRVTDWEEFMKTGPKGIPLQFLRNDSLYANTTRGSTKAFNSGYGPSRVDLGKFEWLSTAAWRQWIGPADRFSRTSMARLYKTYNQDVREFRHLTDAEQMKPLENSFLESALGCVQIFMGMMQGVGHGNYMKFAFETNLRPEVFMRMGGGGSRGFCQPKDIYYPPFVSEAITEVLLSFAGMPINRWQTVKDVALKLEEIAKAALLPAQARELLHEKLEEYLKTRADEMKRQLADSGFKGTLDSFSLSSKTILPSLSFIEAMGNIGIRDPRKDPWGFQNSLVAAYMGEAMKELEGRIRFSDIMNINMMRWAFDEVRKRTNGATASYNQARIPYPIEYKDLSDARLAGLKWLEYMSGSYEHLSVSFNEEGEALGRLLLKGFDRNDKNMCDLLARRLGKDELSETDKKFFEESPIFGKVGLPGDVRMFSVWNMAWSALAGYVAGSRIEKGAIRARQIIKAYAASMSDEEITANCLSDGMGPNLRAWTQLRDMDAKEFEEMKEEIGGDILHLVTEVRLNDPEYKNKAGSDMWEAIRSSDLLPLTVHYEGMTGSEDEAREFMTEHKIPMIADLARCRDTMRANGYNSALVALDSPVQGRKLAFDEIAIKQWLALGGFYISPAIAPGEIYGEEGLEQDMKAERELAEAYIQALRGRDFIKAESIYSEMQKISKDRYKKAKEQERLTERAGKWWRGGGFNNYSERHRLYTKGWARLSRGMSIESFDLETWLVTGGMYIVNGLTREEIDEFYKDFQRGRSELTAWRRAQTREVKSARLLKKDEKEAIRRIFVKEKYIAPVGEERQVLGVRSSIKLKEGGADDATGKALVLYLEQKRARATAERARGYNEVGNVSPATKGVELEFYHDKAMEALGTGRAPINNEQFGRFLRFAEGAVISIINDILPIGQEREKMVKRLKNIFGNGLSLSVDNWEIFMGKGDDYGDIGRLALATDSREQKLRIAKAAGLLDTTLGLILTLDYFNMSPEEVNRTGYMIVSNEVFGAIQKFFSMSAYDHVFDMPPKWIMPSESGIGFTDYHFIMGKWLGQGKPFTRDGCMEIAADTHRWLNGYFDTLMRQKTYFSEMAEKDQDGLLGRQEETGYRYPISAGGAFYSQADNEWWTYTNKRELSYMNKDRHPVTAVLSNLDAERFLDSNHRANMAIIVGPGRTHLTCVSAERPKYNKEHPDKQANLFLTRNCNFTKRQILQKDGTSKEVDVMEFKDGYIYLSKEEFVHAYSQELMQSGQVKDIKDAQSIALEKAEKALKKNPDGILVAVRLARPLICSISIPFHGARHYINGEDERIGLPATQSWVNNIIMYSKGLNSQAFPEASGVQMPPEHRFSREWAFDSAGKIKDKDTLVREIIEGNPETGWIGLAHLPQDWMGIVVKAYSQSGGRQSMALAVRDVRGNLIPQKIKEVAEFISIVAPTDSLVVQKKISADPRTWCSDLFLKELKDGLIKKGIPVYNDSYLFSYSRIVATEIDGKYHYIFELDVASRAAISNVGMGGFLMELRPEHYKNKETRISIEKERRFVAERAMHLMEGYAGNLRSRILQGDTALEPWLFNFKDRLNIEKDATGLDYSHPLYLMHDFLDTPVLMINGEEIKMANIVGCEVNQKGEAVKYTVLVSEGDHYVRRDITDKEIVSWMEVIIENNVGFGLFDPFREYQRKLEHQRAKQENRPVNPFNWGKDVRTLIESWTTIGSGYMRIIQDGFPNVGPGGEPLPAIEVSPEAPLSASEAFNKNIEATLDATRVRLGISKGMEFTQDQFSVFLKYLIISSIAGEVEDIDTWRQDLENNPVLKQAILNKVDSFIKDNKAAIKSSVSSRGFDKAALFLDDINFISRVKKDIEDYIFTASIAPEIQISPSGNEAFQLSQAEHRKLFGEMKVQACIFDNFLGAKDEVYRLMSDAIIAQGESQKIAVIGVHKDWIIKEGADKGRIRRAIMYDNGRSREIDFEAPVMPDRIHVMALSEDEVNTHREISMLYRGTDVLQVNSDIKEGSSLSGAAIADHKGETHGKIKDMVFTPKTAAVPKGAGINEIENIVRDFISSLERDRGHPLYLYIKPAEGTEGVEIALEIISPEDNIIEEFVLDILGLTNLGMDVVISEEVGNVRTINNEKVSLRIEVCKAADGSYHASSGYAQVGKPRGDISSVSQGGRITPIQEIVTQLQYSLNPHTARPEWKEFKLTEEEFAQLKQEAIRALQAVNKGLPDDMQLSIAGIDIEMEQLPDGQKRFYILDINPRGTGLRHLLSIERLYDADGNPLAGRPIVAPQIWETRGQKLASNARVALKQLDGVKVFIDDVMQTLVIRTKDTFESSPELVRFYNEQLEKGRIQVLVTGDDFEDVREAWIDKLEPSVRRNVVLLSLSGMVWYRFDERGNPYMIFNIEEDFTEDQRANWDNFYSEWSSIGRDAADIFLGGLTAPVERRERYRRYLSEKGFFDAREYQMSFNIYRDAEDKLMTALTADEALAINKKVKDAGVEKMPEAKAGDDRLNLIEQYYNCVFEQRGLAARYSFRPSLARGEHFIDIKITDWDKGKAVKSLIDKGIIREMLGMDIDWQTEAEIHGDQFSNQRNDSAMAEALPNTPALSVGDEDSSACPRNVTAHIGQEIKGPGALLENLKIRRMAPGRLSSLNRAYEQIDIFISNVTSRSLDLSIKEGQDRASGFIRGILTDTELSSNFVTHYAVDYLRGSFRQIGRHIDVGVIDRIVRGLLMPVAEDIINKDLNVPVQSLFDLIQDPEVKKEALVDFISQLEDYTNHMVTDDPWVFDNSARAMRFISAALDELQKIGGTIEVRGGGEFLKSAITRFEKQDKVILGLKGEAERYKNTLLSSERTGGKKDSSIQKLAKAYEKLVPRLMNLKVIYEYEQKHGKPSANTMQEEDFGVQVRVEFPVGISYTACAWDNLGRVIRDLDALQKVHYFLGAIKFKMEQHEVPAGYVTVKRLNERKLVLNSKSYHTVIEIDLDNAVNLQDFLDKKIETRLLKEALVANGIISEDSQDICQDILRFTKGGGLEIVTDTIVPGGTGLGTSGALATALCTALDWFTNKKADVDDELLDRSIYLEHRLGLASGTQDCRRPVGGTSPFKICTQKNGEPFPTVEMEFLGSLKAEEAQKHLVLFFPGFKREATGRLNTVLSGHLSRDRKAYQAMLDVIKLQGRKEQAFKENDYETVGKLSEEYRLYREIMDPTTEGHILKAIDAMLKAPGIWGGAFTGSPGGVMMIWCPADKKQEVIEYLNGLKDNPELIHDGQPIFANAKVLNFVFTNEGYKVNITTSLDTALSLDDMVPAVTREAVSAQL